MTRIHNPGAYFAAVNVNRPQITLDARADEARTTVRRIAERRQAYVADGYDWAEANDKAIADVAMADHRIGDDADNQQEN